jgi:Flp pilus assembly protein TadG
MKLDQRGTAAYEFCVIAVPFFLLLFAVFDIGRYGMTVQSLQTLADAGARKAMLCSTTATNFMTTKGGTWPSACTGTSLMSTTEMQNAAPFLFFGGFTPSPNVTSGTNSVTVTATTNFRVMISWWRGLNSPSVTTSIPF